MARMGRALLSEFTFSQPDPISEFGVPATVGLSVGVVLTVCISGLSECEPRRAAPLQPRWRL